MDISERKILDEAPVKRHPWEIARREVILTLLKDLKKRRLVPQGDVLDFGCGDAFITDALANNYPTRKVIGIDNHLGTAQNSELKLYECANVHLYHDMAMAHLKKGSIGLVCLLDILEHIKDDVTFIKQIVSHEAIQKNTLFILTVPAIETLYSKHDYILKHYRRYSLRRISNAAREAGIEVICNGYLFRMLVPIRMIQKFMEKMGCIRPAKNFDVYSWAGGKSLTFFIVKLLLIDFMLFRKVKNIDSRLPGLSCFLVGKK